MTLTLLSVLANIMVISAVRDRLGMGPQYRYRDIISIEPSGRSSLKATTTFFLSTSAVPTCSVLSSPSQFLSSTLGKRLSSFRWSLLVSFFRYAVAASVTESSIAFCLIYTFRCDIMQLIVSLSFEWNWYQTQPETESCLIRNSVLPHDSDHIPL